MELKTISNNGMGTRVMAPTARECIRVLLVDDHAVVRQGLRMFLELESDFNIIGEATNGLEAIELARQLKPDVILMDLVMPVMDGLTAIQKIKQTQPEIEIIALTSVIEDDRVSSAIHAGAIGYLLKDMQASELVQRIRAASRGEVQLHPDAAKRLIRELRIPDSSESLTNREIEILKLIGRGLSNRNMATHLVISEKTVKTHVSNLLNKLNVPSRTQAALYALKQGLVML